jgi:uncharacterized protein (TIGR03435 family)
MGSVQTALQVAIGVALLSPILLAQHPGPPPQASNAHFAVASIKRNLSGSTDDRMTVAPGGRLVVSNMPIRTLIRNVYRVQYSQLAGGPEWLEAERWDILATGASAANMKEMLERIKALLHDRFKLAVHTEMRDAPHYALVMAGSDRTPRPLLQPDPTDCAVVLPGDPRCAATRAGGVLRMSGATLREVAFSLSRMLDRPVVDQTGLPGAYRFELKWDPNSGSVDRAAVDGVSLITALREQLGLSLESRKGPVEFLVIDSAARPVED